MENYLFNIELKRELNSKDFIFLRSLYLPIIGSNTITLYSLISDYQRFYKSKDNYINLKDFSLIMGVSFSKIIFLKKKLEAVGLLRTFQKDEEHFLFFLNPPLSPKKFKNNPILFNKSISKIGNWIFEKFYSLNYNQKIEKNQFKEVTNKYQDIFQIKEINFQEDLQKLENKNIKKELPIDNLEKAIEKLNCKDFIYFISKKHASPSQIDMLERILKLGILNNSINEIISYSFYKNKKIVSKHIEVIANDLIKRKILFFEDVKKELLEAKKYNENKIHLNNMENAKSFKISNKQESLEVNEINNKETKSLSWNDIFDSLGGNL